MGAICSGDVDPIQAAKNKAIEKQIVEEKRKKILKLLLLGPGDSGKSTTLKQIRIIHDKGFSEAEIEQRRSVVYSNIVSGMAALLKGMGELDIPFQDSAREKDAQMVNDFIQQGWLGEALTTDAYAAIKRLWADMGIKTALDRGNEFQLDDSTEYFLNALDRIHDAAYRPTTEDILRTRVATSGVVEFSFFIKKFTFRVFDVGGQKSQRRKWIHCFDDVHAVLFITSLSEYNQNLMEDESVNRMHDSMDLFDSICNNEWFTDTSMILFLNKKDLFAEKIKHDSIKTALPEYKGPQTYEASVAYIRERYEHLNQNPKKTIYTHETCATDTNQIEIVIESVIDVVIQQTLRKVGIQ
uniref:Uncharacterized protein n=1 Tax=Plectus sambesii TaxID=2011161 RepID=A0A914XF24_9BILA